MIQDRINKMINKKTGNGAMLAVKAEYIDITGNFAAAHMLSQLIYWSQRTPNADGWVYKSDADWAKEIRLSRFQVVSAKTVLQDLELIEVTVMKDKVNRTVTHYRLSPDFEEVFEHLLDVTFSHLDVKETNTSKCEKVTAPSVSKLQVQMEETDTSYITKNTNIDYTKIKRTYIASEGCEEILKRWNDYGITVALSVTKELRYLFDELVQVCSIADLYAAMDNYAQIVSSDGYFFKHKYTLSSFIGAGLKSNKGFVHFLPANEPFTKFRDNTEEDVYFDPVTERYDRGKKADFDKNIYYGFDIQIIKDASERREEMDYMLSKGITKWNFGKFWTLELCIASLLFTRKTDPQPEKLKLYMDVWKEKRSDYEGKLEE